MSDPISTPPVNPTRPQASDFVSNTVALANMFIQASNQARALADELHLRGLDASPEQNGLTNTKYDFDGTNSSFTREKILAFYQVIGTLLGGLTEDQQRIIYALKR